MELAIIAAAIAVVVTAIIAIPVTSKISVNKYKAEEEKKLGSADEKARTIIDEALKTAEAKKREALFVEIKEHALAYSVVTMHAGVIDEINILEATKKAMRQCVKELEEKGYKPQALLVDAVKLDGTGIGTGCSCGIDSFSAISSFETKSSLLCAYCASAIFAPMLGPLRNN